MASNILFTLLKFYSTRQRTAVIDQGEFVDYLRRYVQHHDEDAPELNNYIKYAEELQSELESLAAKHQIALTTQAGKQFIVVISYVIDECTQLYDEMQRNYSHPFPNVNELPKHVPSDIAVKDQASDIIFKMLDGTINASERTLYCVVFGKGVPGLLIPSNVSIHDIINICLKKLQDMLRKGDAHDYFQKKINGANPGKEISIKNFFTSLLGKPEETWIALKNNGDSFYYWNQLCYFIRQDCIKMKDLNAEDINVLQTIGVIEVAASYYKNVAAEKVLKEAAFKILDEQLVQPPYYFTMDEIARFKDQNGTLLISKYTEDDLHEHIKELTSYSKTSDLPPLLIFKENETKSYFIVKESVMPLIVRLCNDARELIHDSLSKSWFKYLEQYEILSEMKEQAAFERCLERELKVCSPILYSLLNSTFLPLVSEDASKLILFRDGVLVPYSELLMLRRAEIYSNAKAKLPFWYSMPVISWILSAIHRKSKAQRLKDSEKSATARLINEEKAMADARQDELDAQDSLDPKKSNRKKELRRAATNIEAQIVPENSTIDRELDSYMHEWNDRISKQAHDDLVEDINTLIRDYTRRVLRMNKTEVFTRDRISTLAAALVDTPTLMKIKNHPALKRYVELYMVKLIKNIP
ncbi:MAG: hypothetical protein IIU46_09285 [Treponema sp.]|nr:hypothetical protein [Treponema sp.]